MILFFDTETTGLPKNWKAPVTDLNNWPRLVQLAFLLYDKSGNLVSSGDYIIKPDGFSIPFESSQIHKITQSKALNEGVGLNTVLIQFNKVLAQSEIVVAHNMSFDEKIIGAEYLRVGMPNSLSIKNKLCTMECSTNYCAISGPYGFKWPKLSELHFKLFNYGFEEAHNAVIDIKATAKCYWEMRKKSII
jgi:DNA polymerase III subunit epsilon